MPHSEKTQSLVSVPGHVPKTEASAGGVSGWDKGLRIFGSRVCVLSDPSRIWHLKFSSTPHVGFRGVDGQHNAPRV